MKKFFVIGVAVSMLLSSCSKDKSGCTYSDSSLVAPANEQADLQTYIAANHPAAIKAAAGFYYEIVAPGSGGSPDICSTVAVKYTGKLTNGTQFDANTAGVYFHLGDLIVGWQKGIPLIQKGGTINLYIPPTLGYGATGSGPVPANAILVFNIQLLDYK